MKREDAIGLFGIGMWLLGVLFVGAGLAGVFDEAKGAPLYTQVAAKAHKSKKVPKPHWGLQEFFPLPSCNGGELQTTWRTCITRYNV